MPLDPPSLDGAHRSDLASEERLGADVAPCGHVDEPGAGEHRCTRRSHGRVEQTVEALAVRGQLTLDGAVQEPHHREVHEVRGRGDPAGGAGEARTMALASPAGLGTSGRSHLGVPLPLELVDLPPIPAGFAA